MQVRRSLVAMIGGDYVGVLVEARAAVRHNTCHARPGLTVVDAIASAHHRPGYDLVSEAQAWLEIMPVCHIVRALTGSSKNLSAFQGDCDWLSADQVGVR